MAWSGITVYTTSHNLAWDKEFECKWCYRRWTVNTTEQTTCQHITLLSYDICCATEFQAWVIFMDMKVASPRDSPATCFVKLHVNNWTCIHHQFSILCFFLINYKYIDRWIVFKSTLGKLWGLGWRPYLALLTSLHLDCCVAESRAADGH